MSSQRKNLRQNSDGIFAEYRDALEEIVGVESRWMAIDTSERPFWILLFDAVPEEGSYTVFTFGISSWKHQDWKLGAPELVLNVDSEDEDWAISLGSLACSLRGECPFSMGDVLNFGGPLTQETKMTRFFLFWLTILDEEQATLKLSDRTINFVQAYPIYELEASQIRKQGPEKFFMTPNLDFSDVDRRSK